MLWNPRQCECCIYVAQLRRSVHTIANTRANASMTKHINASCGVGYHTIKIESTLALVARHQKLHLCAWWVAILKIADQRGENQAHLLFVTAHQNGIVQCVLTDLAYLDEVFPQYFVLLHAGNDFAFRGAPDNEFIGVFHLCKFRVFRI